MSDPIRFFSRETQYPELSNFAPFGFEEGGVHWPTAEHYYQAQKFGGPECAPFREEIRRAETPRRAKRLGRSGKHPVRADWDQVKDDVMRRALRKKFERPELRALLMETNDRPLVEDSPFDSYWGSGRDGKGKNRLGVLLMELRAELRKTGPPADFHHKDGGRTVCRNRPV